MRSDTIKTGFEKAPHRSLLKTSFIFATHDEKVIGYLRRIIRLQDGKVVADDVVTPIH